MGREDQRSRYFQEIAQAFFALRGAPYVLSSKDQVTVAAWEETGIPLRVVLEGIRRAFENYRRRAKNRKLPSLSFCQPEVLRAFGEFRDRSVGRRKRQVSREDKKKKARLEVRRFLRALPAEAGFLQDVYSEALGILSREEVEEGELGRLEEKTRELILRSASAQDRAEAEMHVRAEHKGRSAAERENILAASLVKSLREKYKIPHLDLFYY